MAIVGALAVGIGVASWALDVVALPVFLPILLGIGVIAFSPYVVQRLRPGASTYKKGDWAGLIAVQFFGWLGLWFLLLNVFPHAL